MLLSTRQRYQKCLYMYIFNVYLTLLLHLASGLFCHMKYSWRAKIYFLTQGQTVGCPAWGSWHFRPWTWAACLWEAMGLSWKLQRWPWRANHFCCSRDWSCQSFTGRSTTPWCSTEVWSPSPEHNRLKTLHSAGINNFAMCWVEDMTAMWWEYLKYWMSELKSVH